MAGIAYFAARDLKTSGAALSAVGKQYILQLNQQTLQLELGSKTIRVNQRPDTLSAPPLLFNGKLYVPVRLIEKLGCTITDIGSNYFGGECKNHLIVASDDVLVW
ncbi:stalk domain-containing protein [Deinococcus multiflagellatus]|uniref:stalk domain-containing protein n=1 Tax=Deinococcus multiflagellatus TaxID=1656887 RepID=UPI001CC9E146|nr:stalk domain-containing protein [Deinococcus multiflagellatus]MBZ9713723.1 copper amine oxidase N-terminal domain-containing protein [Deinococcus multiflagellatus]